MLLYLGNAAVHEVHREESAPDGAVPFGGDGSRLMVLAREDRNGNACELRLPDGLAPLEALTDVVNVWRHQSAEPPVWVAGEDAALVALLTAQFGCPGRDLAVAQADYLRQCGFEESA